MRGTYILTMELKKNQAMNVGSLGKIELPKGYYYYVGSALGKFVNLENRIKRHKKLNNEKKGNLHWHIDYFLVNLSVEIVNIDKIIVGRRLECEVSDKLSDFASESIPNFGSSDCNCRSHFHYFENKVDLKDLIEDLGV